MGMREGKLEASSQADRVYPTTLGEDEEVECKALALRGLAGLVVHIPAMAEREGEVGGTEKVDAFAAESKAAQLEKSSRLSGWSCTVSMNGL